MTTVTEVKFSGKPATHEGRELTTNDVIECAAELEKLAIETFIARPRVTEGIVRSWLAEHRKGTDTTRQDFDEAIRRYLMTKWEIR